ncbi:hypothetical protein EF847_02310 [Actinobacteria bacterium YIM 96077]|uniref:Pyrrolo-quinoline quinone repeat domain-containing protein n=1 Tax=Phytoactinopolyspora halophila TaxID=1981511 RepID=A0A329QZJ8_9ACTN|nr:PQQ-binding-like beta-propeller repeat protein [Phytoactinopolyspora halophila]AYY11732.1 hypothetical protein EF847_02310 [Actinobacteria bacterium YIM 96077]RAW17834.1 hypothetical protein DPM12_02970 [Phytoactinopolyspora halophila]
MRVTRNRVVAVAAGGVVVLAAGAYLVFGLDRYDEEVSGPSGTYPEAVAEQAPANPSDVLAVADDPWIVDGLRIERAGSGDGSGSGGGRGEDAVVAAYDLRTDAEYWTYRRAGHAASILTAADGLVYVLWDDGLLVQLDPRTAEPRWHRQTEYDRYVEIRVVGETVMVVDESTVTGYELEDGDEAWTTSLPDSCTAGVGLSRHVQVTGDVAVMEAACESDDPGAFVVDADGHETWIPKDGSFRVVRAGSEFALAEMYGDATVFSPDDLEEVAVVPHPGEEISFYWDGNDELLVGRNPDASDEGDVAYAAWDRVDDELAWQIPTDGTWHPEHIPIVVDDLVYALRYVPENTEQRALVVYDAATGDELDRVEIDLAEYLTIVDEERFSYPSVELRISGVSSGTITLTIDGPILARDRGYCDACSIVLADPGT